MGDSVTVATVLLFETITAPAEPAADVTVLVPAEAVVITSATLPRLSPQRLRQALPYALEEQLLTDVDALHFAIDESREGQPLPVAIVEKRLFESWLETLKSHSVTPRRLLPVNLAIPWGKNQWHIVLYQQHAWVRLDAYQAFATEPANLATLLPIALTHAAAPPEHIYIYNFTATPANLQLPNLAITENSHHESDLITMLTTWLDPATTINLLQGHYRNQPHLRQMRRISAYAASATALALGIHFAGYLVSLYSLQHANLALTEKIATLYRHHFPHATAIVAPRSRLAAKWHQLNATQQDPVFFQLLYAVGKALTQHTAITLRTLNFQHDKLEIEVAAATFASLDPFIHALTALGLNVKQQNAAMANDRVNVHLLLFLLEANKP